MRTLEALIRTNQMVELRVRRPDGWTTITVLDDVDIEVAGGKIDGQLSPTLVGTRDDEMYVVELGILDVDEADEYHIENEVPRTADRDSLVLRRLLQG